MRLASFARAVWTHRRPGGAAIRPSWCTYLVTYRCNARCGMCDSWRMKPGTELSPTEVDALFAKVGRLDVVRVTGGEPFLREDLGEICEAIQRRSQPLVLHITTNGSFPERVEALARAARRPKRLRFMVSLDGLAEEHDRNRGAEVTFETALETVGRLVALRPLGVRVSVNHTVISPQSLADSEGLRKRLDAAGVDLHSVLAYAESSMYGYRLRGKKADHLIVPKGYPLHPKLAGADVVSYVKDELRRVRRMRDPAVRAGKRYYLRGLLARLREESDARPKPPCVALRSHLRLLPDGRVPVCQFNTETIGNLSTQSFDEVWKGEAAAESRRWVDDCPGCWAECEVMPSAIYSADLLFDRLPHRSTPRGITATTAATP
jgi:MoaA/NifB/PqqE/SkfB family radical SAM enzyme